MKGRTTISLPNQSVKMKAGLSGRQQARRRGQERVRVLTHLPAGPRPVAEIALIFTNRETIATLALNAKLRTTCTNADIARAGVLMSYGPDFRLCSAGRPRLLTRYFAGQNQVISQSSNQPNSTSLLT